MSPELTALRDEAMRLSCEGWAIQKRWPLSRGIDRSGPCPVCGGTDRFAIHTKKNTFHCRGCGISGVGVIDLVMKTENLEFIPACETITGKRVSDPIDEKRAEENRRKLEEDQARRAAETERYRRRARQDGHDVWYSGWTPDGAGAVVPYLARRALSFEGHPAVGSIADLPIREYDRLPWVEDYEAEDGRRAYRTLHTGPAMLLAIVMPARLLQPDRLGRFGGVHQTWIDLDQPKGKLVLPPDDKGKARPAKKMRGMKQGGAIPLYTPPKPRRIVMGEGAESTLTPFCHAFEPETAYWAGGDLGNMAGKALRRDGRQVHELPDLDDVECFIAPDWCEELVFLTENDEPVKHSFEKCLRGLRRSRWLRDLARRERTELPPLRTYTISPGDGGNDINDIAMDEVSASDMAETADHQGAA